MRFDFDVSELDEVGTRQPANAKPFNQARVPPSGAEVIAMMNGSVCRFAGKNTPDAFFTLCGEFDICNESQLSGTLDESVGYRTVTIDLAQTTFIDASILGVLVRLEGRCRKHNAGHVQIINANAHLRKLFSICGLDSTFGLEDQCTHDGKPRHSVDPCGLAPNFIPFEIVA